MLSQAAMPNTTAAMPTAAAIKRQFVMGPRLRPNRPEGRHASVANSTPKATAGDHEAPMKMVARFSTSPSDTAATTVPGGPPRPPKTQIANTRPMNSRPTSGWSGWIMMMNAPASAALAQAMPKAMRLMGIGDTATSRSANGSCATAMMARPMKVFFRNSSSAASMTTPPTNGPASRNGMAMAPKFQVVVM